MSEMSHKRADRRTFLAGASTLAAGAMLVPAVAQAGPSRYAQSLRLHAEGEVGLDWVLSLLPVTPPPLPPGTVVKARFAFPSPTSLYQDKDVLTLAVYAQLPLPPPIPNEVPISIFHAAIEDVALDKAPDWGPDNPMNNLTMCGRVIAFDVLSPFGDLTGRTFSFSCGFTWNDAQQSAATFKLLTGAAAGSHVTVLREAAGHLEIKRPWQSY
jgi:hypothetical protein